MSEMKMLSVFTKWSQISLVLRIFIGLVLGTILGLIVPHWTFISVLGIVFVSALKAIAPVLVAVLVAASIAKAGGCHHNHSHDTGCGTYRGCRCVVPVKVTP